MNNWSDEKHWSNVISKEDVIKLQIAVNKASLELIEKKQSVADGIESEIARDKLLLTFDRARYAFVDFLREIDGEPHEPYDV